MIFLERSRTACCADQKGLGALPESAFHALIIYRNTFINQLNTGFFKGLKILARL